MADNGLPELVDAFLRGLERLATGERAALKRDAGKTLAEASGVALAAFYRALPERVGAALEGRFFTVACISCLWKPEQLKGPARFYESCLKQVRVLGYESFDKRVSALLDCYWEDTDGYLQQKLCRISRQMRQLDILPNCQRLLLDLVGWNGPDRRVQRRWARVYYGEIKPVADDNRSKEEDKNAV